MSKFSDVEFWLEGICYPPVRQPHQVNYSWNFMGEKLPLGDISYRILFWVLTQYSSVSEAGGKYDIKLGIVGQEETGAGGQYQSCRSLWNITFYMTPLAETRKISGLKNYETRLDFEQKLYSPVLNPDI